MKKIRIISAFLAALMILGVMSVLPAGAIPLIYTSSSSEEGSESATKAVDYEETIKQYLSGTAYTSEGQTYRPATTPQEKLATMTLMRESYGYQLWADAVTGEVATVNTDTGEILFTNPWDVPTTTKANTDETKPDLLSQIIIKYVDNDATKEMNSCEEAAMRGQIAVKYIKGGIRVEYSIGRENARYLVPRMIKRSNFETNILAVMRESINNDEAFDVTITTSNSYMYPAGVMGETYHYYDLILLCHPNFNMSGRIDLDLDQWHVKKVGSFYLLKDASELDSQKEIDTMYTLWPITEDMPIYTLDISTTTQEMLQIEGRIKTYATSYTYENLDADHLETKYEGTTKAPALFKLALEYKLDEWGMSVALPANGIRFDESLYQLTSITMLPYMGAGKTENGGYNFFPDGSGTLFDFEKLNNGRDTIISGKVYGQDYAYHTITGTHQEIIRYPAFGIVENWSGTKTVTDYTNITADAVYDENGNLVTPTQYATTYKNNVEESRGFLAIIEEGDAMAELTTQHMNATSGFNAMQMVFYPRPKDTYNMADAITVDNKNAVWTVVSSRKYVGDYSVRYIMLSDDNVAKESNLPSYYECSWMGMALAYRDYLVNQGELIRLTESDVNEHIPLYIESLGTVETVEKIASIPVNVMTPLTTFGDVKTMYAELSAQIVEKMKALAESGDAVTTTTENSSSMTNINFKLTGFANGGIYSVVPYNLNWEASVGGADGFRDLVDEARKQGFGVFPDFDFVYVNATANFDDMSLAKYAVKTIDNRYTARRTYSATYQTYSGYGELAISPAYFSRFLTKLTANYLKYNPIGISVATLGTDLNSDFDEDEPFNREDSKEFTKDALYKLSLMLNDEGESVDVMTSGGNQYTWKYADYIINLPLNSSRYNDSKNAVPFIGVVLHGFVQYAGTPINEEGDIELAMLKAIENGASIYFKLSYQNTNVLKDFYRLSENYSIRYDIWRDDVVDMYVELNDLLSDLQTKLIIDHEFLVAERNPDLDEALRDEEQARLEAELQEAEELAAEAAAALREALNLRKTPANQAKITVTALASATEQARIAAKAAASIDPEYLALAYDLFNTATQAENLTSDAVYSAYSEGAADAGEAAAAEFISGRIRTQIERAANDVYTLLTAEIADEALKAQYKSAADGTATAITTATVNAVAATAIAKAVSALGNEYKSTAEANEATAAASKAVVEAAVSAANAEANALIDSAEEGFAETVRAVAIAALDIVITTVNDYVGGLAITSASTAYANEQKAVEDRITALTTLLENAASTRAAAIAAGVTEEQLAEAIAFSRYDTLRANLTVARNTESGAKATLDSRINYVYNESAYFTQAVLADANAKETLYAAVNNAVSSVRDYNTKEAAAVTAEELAARADATDAQKTAATTARAAADAAKAIVDALDANIRDSANAVIAALLIRDRDTKIAAALEAEAIAALPGATDAQRSSAEAARAAADSATAAVNALADKARTDGAAVITALEETIAKANADALAGNDISGYTARMRSAAEQYVTYTNAVNNCNRLQAQFDDTVAILEGMNAAKDANGNYIKVYDKLVADLQAQYNGLFALDEYKNADVTAADVEEYYRLKVAVETARTRYETANAAYLRAQAIADSPYGATTAEINAARTSKSVLDTASTNLNTAQATLSAFATTPQLLAAVAVYEELKNAESLKALADAAAVAATAAESSIESYEGTENGAAIIEAARKKAESNSFRTESNTTSSSIRTFITTLDSALTTARAQVDSAKLAVDTADAAVVELKSRWDALAANAESTASEIARAKQFYETGVAQAVDARANYESAVNKLNELIETGNLETVLRARVLIFGTASVAEYITVIKTNTLIVNDSATDAMAKIDDILDARKVYDEAELRYNAALADYEKLQATDTSNMSADELVSHNSELIFVNYRMLMASNAMADATTVINDNTTSFRRSYSTIIRANTPLALNYSSIESLVASAELLYNKLSANAAADPADVAAAYEQYTYLNEQLSVARSLKRTSDENYEALLKLAFEAGLIDENNDVINTPTAPTETEETEEYETTNYTCDDGSVVAVTYGGKDGDDSAPYRTFLLNFNSFTVRFEYNGEEYEIAGYGYHVINY